MLVEVTDQYSAEYYQLSVLVGAFDKYMMLHEVLKMGLSFIKKWGLKNWIMKNGGLSKFIRKMGVY